MIFHDRITLGITCNNLFLCTYINTKNTRGSDLQDSNILYNHLETIYEELIQFRPENKEENKNTNKMAMTLSIVNDFLEQLCNINVQHQSYNASNN